LTFAAWQSLAPAAAAREVHARIAALPAPLRNAALAWVKPVQELAAELTVGGALCPDGMTFPSAESGHNTKSPFVLDFRKG